MIFAQGSRDARYFTYSCYSRHPHTFAVIGVEPESLEIGFEPSACNEHTRGKRACITCSTRMGVTAELILKIMRL